MDATQIVIRPLLTEKSTWEAEARNRYSFQVHPSASKYQVRQAVQELYKVRVESVAIQNRGGKTRRTRFGVSNTGDWKRAVVKLNKEDRIDLL